MSTRIQSCFGFLILSNPHLFHGYRDTINGRAKLFRSLLSSMSNRIHLLNQLRFKVVIITTLFFGVLISYGFPLSILPVGIRFPDQVSSLLVGEVNIIFFGVNISVNSQVNG